MNVFRKSNQKIVQTKFRTDAVGRIKVPLKDTGVYLVNAVHMVDPSQFLKKPTKAEWMSLWASTTFEVGSN